MQTKLTHDHIGQTFGYWTVVSYAKAGSWACKCRCGTDRVVSGVALRGGMSNSCGCRRKGPRSVPPELTRRARKPKLQRKAGRPSSKRIDMAGIRSGMLVAVEYAGDQKWRCICDCGGESVTSTGNLRSGGAKSCGCVRRAALAESNRRGHVPAPDITGQKFGRWTVVEKRELSYWRCLCDCGTERDVMGHDLRSGGSQSCGCLLAEKNVGCRKYSSDEEQDLARAERRRKLYATDPEYRERRLLPGRRYLKTPKGKAYSAKAEALRRGSYGSDLTDLDWQRIQEAWDGKCSYCQKVPEKLTRDHLVPVSAGGKHTIDNVVPACGSCNSRKTKFALDEALKRLGCHGFYDRLEKARGYLRAIMESAA